MSNRNFDYKKDDEHTDKFEYNDLIFYVGEDFMNIVERKNGIDIVIMTITGDNLSVYDWWGWGD